MQNFAKRGSRSNSPISSKMGETSKTISGQTSRESTIPECLLENFTSAAVEAPLLKCENIPKRAPTAYILPQDWSLYVRVCCHLRQIKMQYGCSDVEAYRWLPVSSNSRRRGSCIIRLIAAFNRLYSEYVQLFDAYNEQKVFSQRTKSTKYGAMKYKKSLSKNKTRKDYALCQKCSSKFPARRLKSPEAMLHSYTGNMNCDKTQISAKKTLEESISGTSLAINEPPSLMSGSNYSLASSTRNAYPFGGDGTDRQSSPESDEGCFSFCSKSKTKKGSAKGDQFSQCERIISSEFYDNIPRKAIESCIKVYQASSRQIKVEHIVVLQKADCHRDVKSLSRMRIPIALELTMPRMQRQIEEIMTNCRFVYDPLEVAAELRQTNYNTAACICYFRRSKELREIIQELISNKTEIPSPQCPINSANQQNSVNNIQTDEQSSYRHCSQPVLYNMTAGLAERVHSYLTLTKQKLVTIRKFQCDASRRIEKLRKYTMGLSKIVMQILAEKLKSLESLEVTKRIMQVGKKQLAEGDTLCGQVAKLTQENNILRTTLKLEEQRRKTVFNMMQEYLGNIRVYCRCRGIPRAPSCLEVRSIDTVALHLGGGTVEEYKFDRVFDTRVEQADIYAELAPLVCSFLDGYNVCFLTYGGEASGKTYTLLGPADEQPDKQGITQRALRTVLTERTTRQSDLESKVSVAVVEVYNDTYIDLLSGDCGLHLRVDLGLERMMEILRTVPIQTNEDVEDLLHICRSRRHSGRTALNPSSSRSHLILLARLNSRSQIHGTEVCSVLAICDLAGFEDIIKADTVGDQTLTKEAGFINRSLTALNRVLVSLRNQDPLVVSYRDSKLTYLLKPFFTNSGKCVLIVTVRTDRSNLPSSQSTLRFGRESRAVSLGRARRQISIDQLIEDSTAV